MLNSAISMVASDSVDIVLTLFPEDIKEAFGNVLNKTYEIYNNYSSIFKSIKEYMTNARIKKLQEDEERFRTRLEFDQQNEFDNLVKHSREIGIGQSSEPEEDICVICQESIDDLKNGTVKEIQSCRHKIHYGCMSRLINTGRTVRCPVCKGNVENESDFSARPSSAGGIRRERPVSPRSSRRPASAGTTPRNRSRSVSRLLVAPVPMVEEVD